MIKNVKILKDSIMYLDSSNKQFQAMIPRHAQNVLEQELKYFFIDAGLIRLTIASE